MKKFNLVLSLLIVMIVISTYCLDSLFAIPRRRLPRQNVTPQKLLKELDFPNDEKKFSVQKIQRRRHENLALLYSVQFVDKEGDRYYIQDDYAERNFVCQSFGFGKSFNDISNIRHLSIPVVAFGQANQVVKLVRGNRLVPYNQNDHRRIGYMDILPCQIHSI